jgi:hypothetical protein
VCRTAHNDVHATNSHDLKETGCDNGPASQTQPSRLDHDVAAGDGKAAYLEGFRCRPR